MFRSLILTAAVFAASAPAFAKDPAEAGAVDPDKKVCRYENATGSLMRTRTCHTAAEWKQIEAANAANARQMINHNNATRPAVGN
jgi:hypothetical protein